MIGALAGRSFGYPPFLAKARKFGAKDCTFCHVEPDGGAPWNARGQWLIQEKERRKADAVDVEWLAEYKPEEKKTAQPEAPASGSPVEQELMSLQHDFVEAAKRQDTSVANRVLADDLIITGADGQTISKVQEIAAISQIKIDSYTTDDVKIGVYGDTAVMTYRFTSKGTYQGKDVGGDYREMIVWTKKDGRWQAVAAQVTRIK